MNFFFFRLVLLHHRNHQHHYSWFIAGIYFQPQMTFSLIFLVGYCLSISLYKWIISVQTMTIDSLLLNANVCWLSCRLWIVCWLHQFIQRTQMSHQTKLRVQHWWQRQIHILEKPVTISNYKKKRLFSFHLSLHFNKNSSQIAK